MSLSRQSDPASRPRFRRFWARAGALLLVIGAGAAAVPFEELVVDRVVDGSFESGVVSLTLPVDAELPLFASGWATRGTPVPAVVEDTSAWHGTRALDLRGGTTGPVHVVQDLPVATRGTSLRLAFLPVRGTQVLRLLTSWDRGSTAEAEAALELGLGPDGIDVRTPAGSWRLDAPLGDALWHRLEVVADPRSGLQTLTLDEATTLSVPGIATATPRTLLLEAPAGPPSHFRWDALGLAPLPDLELQLLRSQAMRNLDADAARWLLPRLDGAATALSRGQGALAVPELRAAHRQLGGNDDGAARELRGVLERLLELLAVERDLERSGRR